jgi:hypothetical protein
MRRHYSLSDELLEERRPKPPKVHFMTYRDRVRLMHLDVDKSLDAEFGAGLAWDDEEGVWR